MPTSKASLPILLIPLIRPSRRPCMVQNFFYLLNRIRGIVKVAEATHEGRHGMDLLQKIHPILTKVKDCTKKFRIDNPPVITHVFALV